MVSELFLFPKRQCPNTNRLLDPRRAELWRVVVPKRCPFLTPVYVTPVEKGNGDNDVEEEKTRRRKKATKARPNMKDERNGQKLQHSVSETITRIAKARLRTDNAELNDEQIQPVE